MACNFVHLSHRIRNSFTSLCEATISSIPIQRLTFPSRSSAHAPVRYSALSISASSSFSWDDFLRISQPQNAPNDSSDLKGFFEKIKICNRGSEMHSEFVPFLIEDQIVGYIHNGPFLFSILEDEIIKYDWEMQSEFVPFMIEDQIVGYIHNGFVNHLRRFQDVFSFPQDNSNGSHFIGYVTLHPMLKTPEDRTIAVGDVVRCLGEELIPGIRNELYPVTSSFGAPIYLSLERAAAPYFGIKAYGVHMNGYVERDGQKFLWIGKRSQVKPTYPGMLDHPVAGGLPHGIACGENLMKECEEEAGIPRSISNKAISVGAVSYMDIDGYRYKRDVLFCYDLELPEAFIPVNQDGEVEGFKLIPVTHVANVIRRTQFFKPNCSLTPSNLDQLKSEVVEYYKGRIRYISPEDYGYLKLLQSLRSGDCS